jgi:hypothetical protein
MALLPSLRVYDLSSHAPDNAQIALSPPVPYSSITGTFMKPNIDKNQVPVGKCTTTPIGCL